MARARREVPGADPARSGRSTPTTCSPTPRTLDERVQDLEYPIDAIANGSRGLLEEVATGKVTGEEEYWSRTDLWDFQANVDGAQVALRRRARRSSRRRTRAGRGARRPASPTCRRCSTQQRVGDGFVCYDELTQDEIKALSDAVNALSEPLCQLTAAVLS